VEYDFYSVCVNSGYVATAKKFLTGTDIKVCSVVGFPLGAMSAKAKYFETGEALADGADEIDMVLNVGWLKSGKTNQVLDEIIALKRCVGENRVLKVILETCYLTDEEKRLACRLALDAKADFETAMQYVNLGVERIGTSNGIAILKGEKGTGY